MFHALPAATVDIIVLPGVLGCRILRRTVIVRLGSNPLRLPGGTPLSTVSQRQCMKYTGCSGCVIGARSKHLRQDEEPRFLP